MKTLIKEIDAYTSKESNIKIGLIGDLHGAYIRKGFSKFIDKLNNTNTDIIIINGDICQGKKWSNNKNYKKLCSTIESIAKNKPVVMILGNHDLFGLDSNGFEYYKNLSTIKNVYPLYNESIDLIVKGEKLHISGLIPEASTYITAFNNFKAKLHKNKKNNINSIINCITKLNNNLDSECINILIAHDPRQMRIKEIYNEAKKYDIILSSHIHNGYIINGIVERQYKLLKDLDWLNFVSLGIAKKRNYARGIIYGSEENYILNIKDAWYRYNNKYKLINKKESIALIKDLTPIVITGGVNKFAGIPIDSGEILVINIKKR